MIRSDDFKSVLQPAFALIYNVSVYEDEETDQLTNLLAEKFNEISALKAKGKRKFKAYLKDAKSQHEQLSPHQIVNTKFFQSMQKIEISPHHQKLLESRVPNLMKTTKVGLEPFISEKDIKNPAVQEWVARMWESCLTPEQIFSLVSFNY